MRCRRSRVWSDGRAGTARSVLAALGILAFSSSVADAACTWSFNWYCSSAGCARNTGRSTGTVPGFASEDACRAGIAQFRRQTPGIGVGSCSRQGQCDEGSAARRRPTPGRAPVDQGAPPIDTAPAYDAEAERQRMEQEEEMRRQAEEADRQAKEQAERLAAQRKFNQDKIDVLKGMKGVDFDGSGGVSGSAGDLGLKSSTPTLGIKANPGGDDLALKPTAPSDAERGPRFSKGSKDSAPVPTDLGLKSASPAPEAKPAAKARITAPDVHYLGAPTANLVMDAIEASGHDLDAATRRLDDALWRRPNDQSVRDAYAYVLGMSMGEGIVRAGKAPSGTPEFAPGLLAPRKPSTPTLDRIERERPADVNYAQFQDFQDWDTRFRKIAVGAVSDNDGNYAKARDELERRLKAEPADKALQSAFRVLQGAAVYQDDIDRAEKANAAAGMKQ